MRFDPMTGEPIEEAENTLQFDPMTGEPIKKQETESMQFDPMTGQPVNNRAAEEMQFDPMTGQPVNNRAAEESMQFDPMTGKPIKKNGVKNSKLPKILGIACAAVAAVAIIIFGLVNLLMPNSVKVYMATANTFKEMPHIVEDLLPLAKIMTSAKVTVGVSSKYSGNQISVDFMKSDKQVQAVARLDNDDVSDFKVIANIDKKAVSLYAPKLDDRVFVYDFTQDNDGYIADLLDDDLDAFNDLLKSVNEQDDTWIRFSKDVTDSLIKEFKKVKFEKIASENYTVGDKTKKCKGYQFNIDEELVGSILNSIRKKVDKKEYEEALSALMREDVDIDDMFDDLIEEIDGMDDIKVSVYISGNKLAAVVIEIDDEELEIEFQGRDYRTQTIKITERPAYGKKNVFRMKGSVEGKNETLKFSVGDTDLGKVEYNFKTGEYKINLSSVISAKGILKSSASEVELEIDSGDVTVYAKKGAKFESLKGKKFDLGTADKDDLEDLGEDLWDEVEDADLDDFINKLYKEVYRFVRSLVYYY